MFASFSVRAQSQPFSLVTWGQSVKVLVKEIFVLGTASSRVFTSVGLQVRAWDTDIQSTQRVIYTTRKILTESVLLQADITSTWVLVVTVFVFLTFILAMASLSSVVFLGAVSPLSFFAFAVQVSLAVVITARFLSRLDAADSSEFTLRAVAGEVTLVSTVFSVRSFDSLAASSFFVANSFEASLCKFFRDFNGCAVEILLALFDADILVGFEGELASFNLVASVNSAFFVIVTYYWRVDTFVLVDVLSLSDTFCSFTRVSSFADQIAFFLDWDARFIRIVNNLARGAVLVTNCDFAFQVALVFNCIVSTVNIVSAVFSAFSFVLGVGEHASFNLVTDIGGAVVLVVT